MERTLASHVFVALCGRDLVTLNLRKGEYELLAGLGRTLSLSADHRCVRSGDDELLAELSTLGFFATEGRHDFKAIPPLPIKSVLVRDTSRLAPRDIVWMAAGWADMLVRYHGKSFVSLLDHARRPSGSRKPFRSREIEEAAMVFDRLSIWPPFQGDCLYRCFMLLRRLGPAAHAVDWVFGVRTWPFYAHCWLQIGETCLTDVPDRLVSFSPILAV